MSYLSPLPGSGRLRRLSRRPAARSWRANFSPAAPAFCGDVQRHGGDGTGSGVAGGGVGDKARQ